MNDSESILLDTAKKHRSMARDTRRLARAMIDYGDQLKLQRYADELERQAQELEERASSHQQLSANVTKSGTTE
jgi:tRNA(Leu) C34 or U34 (ribose-2'-O)-methylase TrmL